MACAGCKLVVGHKSASVCSGFQQWIWFYFMSCQKGAEEPMTGVVSIDESPL